MYQNPELELALQFVEKTDRNLFITGKAGTGKTTFLHKIKNESLKRMVVVAPTGVAAINAKGMTIHSFFQIPFGPVLPNQIRSSSTAQRKFSKTKIDIIKSLDLVIIDEISMVRADLLDGIDQVLRRYKDRDKVFGGVQVLMIGDLQQLAPVVNTSEWDLLKQYYETMYFFSSKAFQEAKAISIEFKHIYRQENKAFISILNEVRNNILSEKSIQILNERYNPAFKPLKNEGYITLTTHNKRADLINSSELEKLAKKSFFFNATITGKFSENAYPNSEHLELKVGAQVMFIKNDSAPEKRYFNGKIGVVTALNNDSVTVRCPNDESEIETGYEIWEHINYSINDETKEIKEEIAGSFSQIPLRLAWAITIHKSQGLTFEKVIIDAEASFAHGQTYVALSRCTSLEGIVLKTPIHNKAVINDTTVAAFTKSMTENIPDEAILNSSEKSYQLHLIAEIFDYRKFLYPISRLVDIFYKNRTSLQGAIIAQLLIIKDNGVIALMKVANSFKIQLQKLSDGAILAENSPEIQDRFGKAVIYFTSQTEAYIKKPLEEITFSSDNKAVKKDFKKQFEILQEMLSVKLYILKKLAKGFHVGEYLKVKADAVLEDIPVSKKKKLPPTREPVLAIQLRELRNDIARAENIPHFQVFTQQTLYDLCDVLPRTSRQLLKIKGMGKIRIEKYGDEILETIENYCLENDIQPKNEPKKEVEKSTKQISFELFKEGFSVEEIAKKRGLVAGTIEGHLSAFIHIGAINILELIPEKRYKKLKKEILKAEVKSLSELKEKISDTYSYSEIKMALLAIEFDK
ncbi:MAG: AAA family ATPase [Flavobacteriaceae bacterium]|nr:MAG: AAA family ATPase [Flavobacteriaceae bacterium]